MSDTDRSAQAGASPAPSDRVAAERAWADRVRANAAQVDRVREVPDGADFYAPVSGMFVADPDRTGDAVLDALAPHARPDDVWLDVGAGAGRFALPIARRVREVIAVDTSPRMLAALRDGMAAHAIANVRVVEARWPPPGGAVGAKAFAADVTLIAHVGYDIEQIGPFVDALEAAARRLCVAVLMEAQPASIADPFWPIVHGEAREPLPALADFAALLRTRGTPPEVEMTERQLRPFRDRAELETSLRRQLWIADGSEKERRFTAALDRLERRADDGSVGLVGQQALGVGVVTWQPGS